MATREGKAYGLPVGQYVVSQLGGKWTPEKAKFFGAWAQAEGTSAEYNPFATTRQGYPSTQFNEVGVKNFPNLAVGQRATLDTIKNGHYNDIVELLKDPSSTAEQLASAVSASPWGTGTGVLRVLGVKGATAYEQTSSRQKWAAKKAAVNAPAELSPLAQSIVQYNTNIQAQQDIASRLKENTAPLLTPSSGWLETLERMGGGGSRLAQAASSPMPQRAPAPAFMEMPDEATSAIPAGAGKDGGAAPAFNPGGFVGKTYVLPTQWKGTHITDGLDWNKGDQTAVDLFPGKPGTPVGAPEAGTITRHGSAQGGDSLYFTGKSGRRYWLGHIANAVPVGTKVARGQPIAVVSADHPTPHVHWDFKE